MRSPRLPAPLPVPYFELLRLTGVSSTDDRSTCEMDVGPWLLGAGELGIQAALTGFADTLLSYAATAPDPNDLNVTLGLHVDFWRDPPRPGTRLTGTAEVQHRQGSVALVHGRMLVGDEVLATASLRAMAAPAPPAAVPTGAVPAGAGGAGPARPDASGPVPDADTPSTEPGGDLALVLALELATMGGTRVEHRPDGAVALRLVPPARFERTVGVVHGGAVAAIGQLASAAALHAALPAGVRPRRLSVAVDYLRPTPVGEPLVATARVTHRSRRVVLTEVELATTGGRTTARLVERSVIEP
ncbi:MAG: PaaI family thioesterase [Acidimicrobiia bacterium]